ncbi:MAG: glycoside hydrolase family 97 protein [Ignavibacteria bacterium]|nr:glycoside hydrolase family 97 protein [Ignavibacteria bacterium]
MKLLYIVIFVVFTALQAYSQEYKTTSPDGRVEISFRLNSNGEPQYRISCKGENILEWSNLGLSFAESGSLESPMKVTGAVTSLIDETYRIYSGKSKYSRNFCNETKVSLEDAGPEKIKIDIYLRAYNDGAAFRYGIPQQNNINTFVVSAEETFFNFSGDFECWAMKKNVFKHSYEGEYKKYNLSSINNKPGDSTSYFPYITLPLTMKINNDLYVCLSEANITNYPGMYLVKEGDRTLKSKLSPDVNKADVSVRGNTPAVSPWRLFIIGVDPGDLIESNLIMNLNEPCMIPDAESWIKPGKTAWNWWSEDRGFDPSFGYQILANKTVKYYIDFAAANNLQYMTLDGGWYGWFDAATDMSFRDLTKTLPELDLQEVSSYAANKGVGLILWVVWSDLEKQMGKALDYYQSLGIKGIKMDFMDRDDQYMTGFYRRVAEECASRKMFVVFHGSYKPDGLSRTYPNILSYEGVLGNEYSRWSNSLPNPEHNVTIPFTRLIAGPMDYTPGSFTNATGQNFTGRWKHPVTNSTRAQQLAMSIVYESGIQSLCESPKIYEQFPEFDLYRRLPGTWDSTIVIDGKIGEYIIIARKFEDEWFIGGMTNSEARDISFGLKFLGSSRYETVIYSDASDGDTNPGKVIISKLNAGSGNKIALRMAKGGGFAVILKEK